MLLADENLSFDVQIATVVVPIAVYFLILGLLNSRRHPQMLSGRLDFALLIAPLSLLFVLPVLNYAGVTAASVVVCVGVVVAWVMLLAPRGRSWVIYNIPLDTARDAVVQVLRAMGFTSHPTRDGLQIEGGDTFIEIGGFPLLRNVSIRLRGGEEALARRIESALAGRLASMSAETSTATVSMLLVATAMLVLPLTLVAPRAGELVRLLTDLLP